ncbi:MAG: malto-oligosyltrehalose synthase [Rhizobacter sp.]|nr:malto-oligosyltrehalose synthase [Rhizobacter sp.]
MDEHRQAVARLCAVHGVLTDYHDVWGQRHQASTEALVKLLAELGVDASSADAAAVAEREARAAREREVVPPLVALTAGHGDWSVPVRLPKPLSSLRWTLIEEGGQEHAGEMRVDGDSRDVHLRITRPMPMGYHHLRLDDLGEVVQLVAASAHCYQPPALADSAHAGAGSRTWGPAVQLYALRSERNWGIGDFGDLATVIEQWSRHGAGIVGVNPLHAMFSHNPRHTSPYSPSSRLQLNTLYLDVEALPDLQECEPARRWVNSPEVQARRAALRATTTVDYEGVASLKTELLRQLYRSFRCRHLATGSSRAAEFRRFQAARSPDLRLHASFEALQAHFHAQDSLVWGWPVWPEPYRQPGSPEVQRFIAEHEDEVEFHEYLQWQADLQLARLSRRCRERGMAVGLYLDLAVSVDRAGSDTWGHQSAYAGGATVGAPPDEVNPNGQGWGLPPLRPDGLKRDVGLFVATLRAAMRHAGAVRIDHVMGLMRLYWIPPGATARDGSYVLYPLQALLAIVALESERNRCMVIGEDLGTVADEMRSAMQQRELLSYRLLYFEREHGGGFKAPEAYPRQSLVAVSTHDLPTLAGWWRGHDLDVRQSLKLFPTPQMHDRQREERAHDRLRLLNTLQQRGLLPPEGHIDASGTQPIAPAVSEAVHAYVASTPAQLMMVQLEDALGVPDQANLPGTVDEHPNWRRKLPLGLEAMAHNPRVSALCARLASIRPSPARTVAARPQGRAVAVIPRATYRLQLHKDFSFDDAVAVLPYLQRLGVSHLYCSPIWRARPGSLHGYDVVAHDEINPELGGRDGFERFANAARELGLGLILDMVPNHMGVLAAENPWWTDVLENGQASAYARHFDIDWHPVNADLEGKVLLPVLGEHYGDVLASGQLKLAFEPDRGRLLLRYFDHCFPLALRSYELLLTHAAQRLGDGHARGQVEGLAESFAALPARTSFDPAVARTREELKSRFAELAQGHAEVAAAVDAALAAINAEASRDTLHALHEGQHYRLAYWRVAADEINYRRFFDINDLAALRMEEPAVFEATHSMALDLAAQGVVDGLRIDHPDGLHDPARYFAQLQQGYAERAGLALPAPAQGERPARPLYVVAEKIAAPHEDVPEEWAIHGTTGYRFAMVAGGVLVDGNAAERFDRIWQRFSGECEPFAELVYRGKRSVARIALASELTVLATALMRIARADRRTRDYTFNALRDALAEVAACMPVYRTYILGHASAQDIRFLDWAIAHARKRSEAPDRSVFDFVGRVLRGQGPDGAALPPEHAAWQFAARFQQFCAPVAAKGVEDTAFYQYHRLVSQNEVGGDPGPFGMTVRAFHGASSDRAARWPHTILATSTHDNKRSEDVRNRLNVLSEMPAAWRLGLARWRRLARQYKTELNGEPAPSAADEYLLYQTVLGTLPAEGLAEATLADYRERIVQYMLKAAREAKRHTSWTCPDEAYENALTAFVRSVLARVSPNPLLGDLQASASALAWFGALNSLSLVLMKFTSPGVPDVYQGNELLDLSLVDPDNRRPVDFGLRDRHLAGLEALHTTPDAPEQLRQLAAQPFDGRAKLWLTWRLLQLRAEQATLFRDGRYVPLAVTGARQEHLVAYAREQGHEVLVVLAARLFARLQPEPGALPLGEAVWGDTAVDLSPVVSPVVEPGVPLKATDALTGRPFDLSARSLLAADAFASFPAVALRFTK